MRIIIVGPGRAGGAVAAAAHRVGHEIAAVIVRRQDDQVVATSVGTTAVLVGDPLPDADLLIIAVRDDVIGETAESLAPHVGGVTAAVHLSGLARIDVLEPLAAAGVDVGSFHPLQTFPTWQAGANALTGAHVAITAGARLSGLLAEFATSFGASVFYVDDDRKALYHAAAAASANYVITAMAIGEALFEAADVDPSVAAPLVRAVVVNALEMGPREALTGPIARGDLTTVAGQLDAIATADPSLLEHFKAMGRATAELAGADEAMREVLS